ncbi:MAG: T9SS type A sorting domain-containing protein [Bacteroidales bacterium]|nr:T9SS type A sorting domain-containing protein [Bacteroidales bacterium]
MRRRIITLIFALIGLVSLNAQTDTAYVQNLYSSQYIYPPIIDTNYTSINTLGNYTEGAASLFALASNAPANEFLLSGFAQRYEVKDSVKIMGVALMINGSHLDPFGNNQITISVWDSTMTNLIHVKNFIDGGVTQGYQYPATSIYPFIEFIFDVTLTLYEDYHISVEYPKRCESLNSSEPLFMVLSDYIDYSLDGLSGYCVPYGICTKYRPYVRFGCDNRTPWTHVDNVTNWFGTLHRYDIAARYQISQLFNPDFPPELLCDTAVYKAIGLCPIRALEDTLSDGNDSTLNGNDTISNGGDTISNGGDSTNSALQLSKQLDESVKLSPIPADEVLNIYSDYNILSVEVFDVMNRFIERKELNAKSLQLNISKYQSGTYFIRIKTDKGFVKKKFIVG